MGRWIAAALLLLLALFCGVGFLATFEPLDGGTRWAWRLGYGAVGLAALAGFACAWRAPPGAHRGSREGDAD